jgi:hypothetical protein
MVQPLHEHRQITTIGAERILRQVPLQPKGIEKLFDLCEILFHIGLFVRILALCLIEVPFWYTARKDSKN